MSEGIRWQQMCWVVSTRHSGHIVLSNSFPNLPATLTPRSQEHPLLPPCLCLVKSSYPSLISQFIGTEHLLCDPSPTPLYSLGVNRSFLWVLINNIGRCYAAGLAYSVRADFLNLGTVIWGWGLLCCRAVLCVVRCLTASLASTH